MPASQQENTAHNKRVAGLPYYLFTLCCHCKYLCSRSRFHRQRGWGAGTLVHEGHSPAVGRENEGKRENDVAEHGRNETRYIKTVQLYFCLCNEKLWGEVFNEWERQRDRPNEDLTSYIQTGFIWCYITTYTFFCFKMHSFCFVLRLEPTLLWRLRTPKTETFENAADHFLVFMSRQAETETSV